MSGASAAELPELRLPCRVAPGVYCARCCYGTEMPLTEDDVRRLERLGYRRAEFAVRGPDGVLRLRNVGGRCYFLDPRTGACRVYEHRPLGCRLYPLVCVPGLGVTVDPECPLHHLVGREAVSALAPHVRRLVRAVYGRPLC